MTEPAETEPLFKIESLDDFRRVMVIAQGGNPDAIQAITEFMNFKSNAERSYFPDKATTLATAQLNGFGKLYYPNDDWNPFSLVADMIAVHFMGYKGYKSNQFVDMTRQSPNLADIETSTNVQERKANILDRILGRGKTE